PNRASLRAALKSLLPTASIQVQSIDGGIVLDGYVASAVESEDAQRLAAGFVADTERIINRLHVTEANQVNLRVRVAEVSRNVLRELGINWSAALNGSDIAFGVVTQGFGASAALLGGGLQPADNYFLNVAKGDLDLNALIDALAQENLVSL